MNAPLNPTQLQIDVLQHAVANSTQHESAHLHVTGEAIYTDDIAAPRGTLSAAIGYAPAAHALSTRPRVDLATLHRTDRDAGAAAVLVRAVARDSHHNCAARHSSWPRWRGIANNGAPRVRRRLASYFRFHSATNKHATGIATS